MAKVQGPLLSMGGTGQIGKSQVYATWKGRPYARRYVVPSNPQSTEQTKTRTAFGFLSDLWRLATSDLQAPWKAFAKGKPLTDRNVWLSKNLLWLRPQGFAAKTTLLGMILSPGANAGLVATPAMTLTGGDAVFTADAPDPLPAGWSIVGYVGVAIPEQDPQTDSDFTVDSALAPTPAPGAPYVATLNNIGAGVYATGGWFIYQRSANPLDLAYGPSVAVLSTVIA